MRDLFVIKVYCSCFKVVHKSQQYDILCMIYSRLTLCIHCPICLVGG